MVLLRASPAFRTLLSTQSRRIAGSRASSRVWQQVSRRGYASEAAHGEPKASSDLPWLFGSIVITAPAAYFLWTSGQEAIAHSHDDHSHEEEHESHKAEEPVAEPVKEEAAPAQQPDPVPETQAEPAEEPKQETETPKEAEAAVEEQAETTPAPAAESAEKDAEPTDKVSDQQTADLDPSGKLPSQNIQG